MEKRHSMVTKSGAHSAGNPDEFEDVSEVNNKLAVLLFNEISAYSQYILPVVKFYLQVSLYVSLYIMLHNYT